MGGALVYVIGKKLVFENRKKKGEPKAQYLEKCSSPNDEQQSRLHMPLRVLASVQ